MYTALSAQSNLIIELNKKALENEFYFKIFVGFILQLLEKFKNCKIHEEFLNFIIKTLRGKFRATFYFRYYTHFIPKWSDSFGADIHFYFII